jgi:hypothetical protein
MLTISVHLREATSLPLVLLQIRSGINNWPFRRPGGAERVCHKHLTCPAKQLALVRPLHREAFPVEISDLVLLPLLLQQTPGRIVMHFRRVASVLVLPVC